MSWKPISANRAANWRRRAVAGGTAALLVPMLAGMNVPPPSGTTASPRAGLSAGPAQPRRLSAQRPVPVHAVRSHHVRVPVMHAWHAPKVSWPAAGTATSALPAAASPGSPARTRAALADARALRSGLANQVMATPSAGSVRAGSLPVWVGPPVPSTSGPAAKAGERAAAAAAVPGRVSVVMAARKAAAALGVSGVVFTVSGAGGSAGATAVHVSLDYSSFAFADGGDYAGRLHLVELPACALTTPGVPACRRQTALASANDVGSYRLGANVSLPAAVTASSSSDAPIVVLAATTSTSGSAGSYAATPFSEAGTWSEGGSSGAFTYSYPISVPPVPGGLAPQVSLGYNSQATDGLTSSTDDQASWIGDGWDYEPGFIERDYQSCEQNPAGSTQTGDLCWSSNDVTTLSLDGVTTTLVDDPTAGWHAEADNGDKITYETGSGSNGTHDDDYWVVTDPDGTSYYFGLNELPGYASGDAATSSAWTVPVYATASGQPCYNATFADSHCEQAWRWNLDYVTDSHGDAMAYFYNTETNYYAADNGTTATAAYIQGGALAKVEYGVRAGAVYGVTPAAEVTFTTGTSRTDVPTSSSTGDLACSSGAACDVISPTFWIKYQLTTIATQTLKGSALEPVDSWALAQDFPATGDGSAAPPMWLESITRTGEDGTAISLPPVTFKGISLPNRVETATDLGDGYSIIDRFRLSSITNETGGVTTVSYDTPPSSCTSGNFPAADANTTECYPDYWTPPGASSPVEDWFNKYVVTSVTQANTVGGTTPVITSYTYSGAAWHYDDDTLTRSNDRTWDQWRGFRTVTTETGTSPDPVTETTDTYFQGMNGDYQSGGGTSSVSLTSRVGDLTVTDSDQFAGLDFEHTVYDGAGGAILTDAVTTPWTSAATATQSQPSPLPSLQAFMTGTAQTQTFTALASGGYREAEASYSYDSDGRVTSEADVPDLSDDGTAGNAAEDTCTQTTYAANTTSNLLDLPAEVIETAVPPSGCPISGSPTQAELVSDTRYYYDGSTTLGAAPSAGNVTMTQKATSYSGTTEEFTTQAQDTYDEYGRVLTATNADGYTTTSAYTPATGAEPTSEMVTDPMGLVTTTTYDPARDLPLTVTNPAGWVTTETYDALGRLTAAWTPGHPTSDPADQTFSYEVSGTAPSEVTTNTINDSGTYLSSETLYDSLGRQVETQSETAAGGREITDTQYNSDGWPVVVSNPYYTTCYSDTACLSDTLVAAPDDEVPSQTGYVYDGDGRVTRQISYSDATELWETDTSYGGDYTTVTPPAGGTAETTYVNGNGQTSYIYEYHSATPPSSPPAPGSGSETGSSGWDQTAYTYAPAQQLATITDAAGNQWTYGYNLAGDQTSATDPDAGTSTRIYDADGNLLSTTDARGKTTSYAYDKDDRKVAEYDTTGGAAESGSDELASWTYDTLAKGQLTSASSYGTGGTSGTTYTDAVTGYNSYGLTSGTEVSVSAGPLAGTYKQSDYYSTYADLETSYEDTAAGGLPAETVDIGYNTANQPTSLTSSLWDYVASLSYTELGQPQEYTFGTTTEPAWLLNSYSLETNQLTSAEVQTGTSPVTVDDTSYSYDNAGLITAEADTPADGPAQVQCFDYDYLGRLTQAWSQGSAGCSSGPSQSAESGAAAPYWEQYAYNDVNDLTSATSTPASGSATTITNSYPAGGSAQPHAITSQQVSAPSGTSTTSFKYDADGDTTSIAASSDTQTLDWNDAGQLTSVASTGGPDPGTTSYVYDADGNLLLQSDPGSVTLYLPDEQLTENTSTGTVTGTRYYAIGGVTVAARTSGTVYYLTGDQQGTDSLAISAATLAVTRRYYDPYGNAVGTAPSSWPGDEGFVGGTTDPDTGLVNLGVREYNSATASFINPDPLLSAYDPQDLNAYAYATDDPASDSDPSGAMFCDGGGYCGGGFGETSSGTPTVSAGPAPGTESSGSTSGGGRTSPSKTVQVGPIALPANYPHVTQILAQYKAFLPTYYADRPGSVGVGSLFDSLETFCNQNSGTEALCGPRLSHQLLLDYLTMAAVANGPGFNVGEAGDDDQPETNEEEAHVADVAASDSAQIDDEFCGDDCAEDGDVFAQLNAVASKEGADVAARLYIGQDGDTYLGTSTARGNPPIKGTWSFFVEHAEGDVFSQAMRGGNYTGQTGTLYVSRDIGPCGFCVSGISTSARSMGLSELTIFYPGGVFGVYTPATGLVLWK
jgi:RHS repeat-associated protein